jgi:hypothetical protein
MRSRVLAALVAVIAVLTLAAPARADGLPVSVTIHTDGGGAVWAVVTWSDGEPVTEAIVAVMSAFDAEGAPITPVTLRSNEGGDGRLTYAGSLAPGPWQVGLDVSSPGLASCQADFTMTAENPVAQQSSCTASFWPEPVASEPEGGSGAPVWPALIGMVVVGLIVLGWIVLRRRRDQEPAAR